MPHLAPFRALRYSRSAGALSDLLAPPYDIIDAPLAEDLRARDPHNTIRLVLPEGREDQRYEAAANLLREWYRSGILAIDPTPAVYVYRQTFAVPGGEIARHGFFAELRVSHFGAGEILPHEHTHAGPKLDRLALTLATRTQLSSVFMIARDPDHTVMELLRRVTAVPSAVEGRTPDGIRHELWMCDDPEPAGELCIEAGSRPLLIADGHHRYETAISVAESLGDSVKAANVLTCVVSENDPGLMVRPTHRALPRPPTGAATGDSPDWLACLEACFTLEAVGPLPPAAAADLVATEASGCFAVAPATEGGTVWLATARPAALAERALPRHLAAIAPVVFDRLVLETLYDMGSESAARNDIVRYAGRPEEARDEAGPVGCSFYLPPLALDDVWAAAERGERLPPKSTYFEPKIPSGILFRPL